jgi:diguanylate cyclase (GGDEF)-like protein
VFRFGGDEFVLTVADREAEDLAEFRRSISANLRRRLRQQELAGLELELSLGFVAVGEEAQPSERYVAAADVAMYRDKQEKRPAPLETGESKPESMEPVA